MRGALLIVSALLFLGSLPPAAASPSQDARSALDTLVGQRGPDGAFDPTMAALATEAAAAQGIDPATWPDTAHPVLASLRPLGGSDLLAQLRSIHARAVSAHGTPADTQAIRAAFHDGQFGDLVLLNDDVWAIRSLRDLGVPARDELLQASAHFLALQQGPDGGWSWRVGGSSSSDVTGMALESLAAAQALDPVAAQRAAAYLGNRTATAGGFKEDAQAAAANCDSTVWGIRGLHAVGAPVPEAAWHALGLLHKPDGGYAYQEGQPSNALCTAEVATLLGEWAREGRDLTGYGPKAHALALHGLMLPLTAVGLALVVRRRLA